MSDYVARRQAQLASDLALTGALAAASPTVQDYAFAGMGAAVAVCAMDVKRWVLIASQHLVVTEPLCCAAVRVEIVVQGLYFWSCTVVGWPCYTIDSRRSRYGARPLAPLCCRCHRNDTATVQVLDVTAFAGRADVRCVCIVGQGPSDTRGALHRVRVLWWQRRAYPVVPHDACGGVD